ncbi:MAG: ABC transporter permease subunit, partial [Gammaproteobacteria bacterium]|nr:ABC transporter permease subunit [Gammaproteobacteria bacterium]
YVVIPMFESAEIKQAATYAAPGAGKTLHLGLEEQGTLGVRFTDNGHAIFFDTTSGEEVSDETIDLPAAISSVSAKLDLVVLGLENGSAIALRYKFDLSYPDDIRTLTPALEYPLGKAPLPLDESAQPLTQIDIQLNSNGAGLAATTGDNRLVFARYSREESFISGDIVTELQSSSEKAFEGNLSSIVLTPALDHLYTAAKEGELSDYSLGEDGFDGDRTGYHFNHEISRLKLLLGGNSLLVGMNNGEVQQWMSVRKENGRELTFIREFQNGASPAISIATEVQRKGFAVADDLGDITLYYSTSQRTLASINTADAPIEAMAWSARAQNLIAADNKDQIYFYDVHNDYPEVSWGVLWEKVWYEGYDEPDYIWQSSASTNEFEPKFSLMPLSFGTIKAAFYAMLFAVPIAILGAMFAAQFMAPKMRQTVKPAIEIMEALPTVILGFLAGLWLAPYVELHLAGVFILLLLLPASFVFCAWLWGFVPNKAKFEGWEAALLVPVILFLIWFSMALSNPVENIFFNGSLSSYLSNEWGIDYDQRNSLVVGLIMGFAVIPTIFSIAEDALFSVPQHLVRGSLALGATRWQTMTSVVLPAASPGIFSAVMMGFGRAVGETMIVLMATGNTPLMDASIFQGMRTLAANLAVEVPEAEVFSTHYRVLFLAALILFLFTFVFNTLAEIIRHRLRKRYSGL